MLTIIHAEMNYPDKGSLVSKIKIGKKRTVRFFS